MTYRSTLNAFSWSGKNVKQLGVCALVCVHRKVNGDAAPSHRCLGEIITCHWHNLSFRFALFKLTVCAPILCLQFFTNFIKLNWKFRLEFVLFRKNKRLCRSIQWRNREFAINLLHFWVIDFFANNTPMGLTRGLHCIRWKSQTLRVIPTVHIFFHFARHFDLLLRFVFFHSDFVDIN